MARLFGPTPTKLFSPDPEKSSGDSSSKYSSIDKASRGIVGTPKMDTILRNNQDIKTGYYGGLQFLDNQKNFNRNFGREPTMLPTNPTSSSGTANAKLLLDFSEKMTIRCILTCMLQVLCRQ